jgi:hypothetical protein
MRIFSVRVLKSLIPTCCIWIIYPEPGTAFSIMVYLDVLTAVLTVLKL